MNTIQNIVEYYDELYPVSGDQKKFYEQLFSEYTKPIRLLRVKCATGYFEHLLARNGEDVTGIEDDKDLLHSANLRRRNQLMSIRFFEMSTLDMTRFLGKNFYNVISVLDDKLMLIHDKTLLRKFFYDTKELIAPGGVLVIQGTNFGPIKQMDKARLPVRESVRVKLLSEVYRSDDKYYINQNVETGNGKILPVMSSTQIYPVTIEDIKEMAGEAGYKNMTVYADFAKTRFTGSEDSYVVVIR